jgi:nucleoside 2-deoxyribosyltransferase
MIYLASPYSHPDPAVQEQRFLAVCEAAAKLMVRGYVIFSPVAHSHPIAQFGLPKDWNYWAEFDRDFLSHCDSMIVLMLPGWRESVGVRAEIAIMTKMKKTIAYISPERVGIDPAFMRGAPGESD